MTVVELAPTPSLLRAMNVLLSSAPRPLSPPLFAVVAKAASTCRSSSLSCFAMRIASEIDFFPDGARGEYCWVVGVLTCSTPHKHLDQLSVEVDNGARCRDTWGQEEGFDEVHKNS